MLSTVGLEILVTLSDVYCAVELFESTSWYVCYNCWHNTLYKWQSLALFSQISVHYMAINLLAVAEHASQLWPYSWLWFFSDELVYSTRISLLWTLDLLILLSTLLFFCWCSFLHLETSHSFVFGFGSCFSNCICFCVGWMAKMPWDIVKLSILVFMRFCCILNC
jgi:hypothetical protein